MRGDPARGHRQQPDPQGAERGRGLPVEGYPLIGDGVRPGGPGNSACPAPPGSGGHFAAGCTRRSASAPSIPGEVGAVRGFGHLGWGNVQQARGLGWATPPSGGTSATLPPRFATRPASAWPRPAARTRAATGAGTGQPECLLRRDCDRLADQLEASLCHLRRL